MLDNEPPQHSRYQGSDMAEDFVSSTLNPRFTFYNFMVGRSNSMAYAGAMSVGEHPARSYNPLFIYGGVGLGKTHLAQAIGQEAMSRGYTVFYTTAEAFGNDLIDALSKRAMEEFRLKYRSMDVLLVDDVQYVEGKQPILDELFHTIDSLHQHDKQSVLCSDRHPNELKGLTDQMRSRLTGGSIVDVILPDMELRTAILRSKPEVYANDVPLDIVDFVARQVKSNVRVLEGALQNVIAMARLQHLPYSLELAKEAIAPILKELGIEPPPRQSPQGIVQLICKYYKISKADIYSQRRSHHIAFPRQVAMYLMRNELVMPLEAIGNHLGGRDHSTVIYGYRRIEQQIKTDEEAQGEVHYLRQKIYDDDDDED
jgi:chromosomal replication initiator protein